MEQQKKIIIFESRSTAMAEVVQRIAFDFGYFWPTHVGVSTPRHLDAEYFFFYPNKDIYYSDSSQIRTYIAESVQLRVNTVEDFLKALKEPDLFLCKSGKDLVPLIRFKSYCGFYHLLELRGYDKENNTLEGFERVGQFVYWKRFNMSDVTSIIELIDMVEPS